MIGYVCPYQQKHAMRYSIFSLIIILSALLGSCAGSSDESQTQEKTILQEGPACAYSLISSSSTLTWTAYKTTAKVPVSGVFDTVLVSSETSEGSIVDIMKGAEVDIPVATVNSNNPDRDMKIGKFFFGVLTNPERITGKVVSVEGDENGGKAVIAIGLNGLSKEVTSEYEVVNNMLRITMNFDVNTWDGQAAVAALNEACYILHQGEDGESALWSEVAVEIVTTFNKPC